VTSPPPTSATIKLPFLEQLSSRKPAIPESASGVDTAESYKDSDSSRRNRNVYIALLTRWRRQTKAGHSPYRCPSTCKTNTSHRRWTGRPPRPGCASTATAHSKLSHTAHRVLCVHSPTQVPTRRAVSALFTGAEFVKSALVACDSSRCRPGGPRDNICARARFVRPGISRLRARPPVAASTGAARRLYRSIFTDVICCRVGQGSAAGNRRCTLDTHLIYVAATRSCQLIRERDSNARTTATVVRHTHAHTTVASSGGCTNERRRPLIACCHCRSRSTQSTTNSARRPRQAALLPSDFTPCRGGRGTAEHLHIARAQARRVD
ncbi:hypothetical protein LSAT2_020001, partial [Lamellibrachia satsuma]